MPAPDHNPPAPDRARACRALNDWLIEYEDGIPVRMRWLGLMYGPPCPADVRPAPCRQHDRLTFPCDECAAHALGNQRGHR